MNFISLLQTKEIAQITVSDICKKAEINRSTFYANYIDIYDLADQIRKKLEQEVKAFYNNETSSPCDTDYLKLFCHIRDNQMLYQTYFKLGYDHQHVVDLEMLPAESKVFPEAHMEYHVEFHKAGLNAIIKKWLSSGCLEPPETMAQIIKDEYTNRHAIP